MEHLINPKWLTTNQDEYRNPSSVKINRYLEGEEMARFEECVEKTKEDAEQEKLIARQVICCREQQENREPIDVPKDYHIDPDVRDKPSYCRCLATGDPTCTEEQIRERETNALCACKKCYGQLEGLPENVRQKFYASTNFVDFRDPKFPYITNKLAIQKKLDDQFKAYKAKADALDAAKEPKIAPAKPKVSDRVNPNCMGIFNDLPDLKLDKTQFEADETWWRTEPDECRKNMVKKYMWTTTYREMNKDGAALPLPVREIPDNSLEFPPGDPTRSTCKPSCTKQMEKCCKDPYLRMAQRCDTMYNDPDLDKDPYFQEHRLCRTKYARPSEAHEVPTEENIRLAKADELRMPYDRMIPGYAGYQCRFVAPPVCKIKKKFNDWDPYDSMSTYQGDFMFHPKEAYEEPVKPLKPDEFEEMGISCNPMITLAKTPLPEARRLSSYLECNSPQCPKGTKFIPNC